MTNGMKKRSKGYFSISAVAKMFSVHQQTIRFYEKEGLITPQRSEGNTRMFTEEDVERLQIAVGNGCIDQWKIGTHWGSAVAQLAMENNREATEFLIRQGSSINQAVKGAAIGGHFIYVEELLNRGASINWAALGAAAGNYPEYAKKLVERGASNNWVAMGAAITSRWVYSRPPEWIAEGMGIGNDRTRRWLGSCERPYAEGAAIGGYHAHAEELLSQEDSLRLMTT